MSDLETDQAGEWGDDDYARDDEQVQMTLSRRDARIIRSWMRLVEPEVAAAVMVESVESVNSFQLIRFPCEGGLGWKYNLLEVINDHLLLVISELYNDDEYDEGMSWYRPWYP